MKLKRTATSKVKNTGQEVGQVLEQIVRSGEGTWMTNASLIQNSNLSGALEKNT